MTGLPASTPSGRARAVPRLSAPTRILQAAAACIVARGASQLSLQEVAQAADVSKGLIHYHFHDKETLLARLARVDVLVLDDWGLAVVKDGHRHDLLEMLDDRDGSRSTVITSQLPRERWHDYLGDPTVADAILDRLVHRAHPIALAGPSRRKEPPPAKKSAD